MANSPLKTFLDRYDTEERQMVPPNRNAKWVKENWRRLAFVLLPKEFDPDHYDDPEESVDHELGGEGGYA